MKYKIGDFSKISGVSQTSLRFFEQSGLVAPARSENGYRMYSIIDSYRVNTFNSLTVQGYTLSQAAERTDGIAPQIYVAELGENIRKMQREKELLDKRIEWAETMREVYGNAEYYLRHPIEKHLPECSFLSCVDGEDLSPSLSIGDRISAMVDILPFTTYAGRLEKDKVPELGMLAQTSVLHKYGIDTSGMLSLPEGDYAVILCDAANIYADIDAITPLKVIFPHGLPEEVYVIYTMVETGESYGRGFVLVKK